MSIINLMSVLLSSLFRSKIVGGTEITVFLKPTKRLREKNFLIKVTREEGRSKNCPYNPELLVI